MLKKIEKKCNFSTDGLWFNSSYSRYCGLGSTKVSCNGSHEEKIMCPFWKP